MPIHLLLLFLHLLIPTSYTATTNQTWVVTSDNAVWGIGGREGNISPNWSPSQWGDVIFFNKSVVRGEGRNVVVLNREGVFAPKRTALWGRVGHTADAVGGGRILVLFGKSGNGTYDQLDYVDPQTAVLFQTTEKRLQYIQTTGDIPPARSLHVSAYDAINDRVFVYGGELQQNASGNARQDWQTAHTVHVLSCQTWTWSKVVPPLGLRTQMSTPVVGATAVLMNGSFIVCFGKPTPNPCLEFQTGNLTWAVPMSNGSIPSPRIGASLTQLGTSNLAYLFGGYDAANQKYLDDLWRLEMYEGQLQWVPQPHPDNQPGPTPRAFHAAVDLMGRLGIYGGQSSTPLDQTLFLFSQGVWNEGTVQRVAAGRPQGPTLPTPDTEQPSVPRTQSRLPMIVGLTAGGLLTFIGAAVVVRRRTRASGGQRGLFLRAVSNRIRNAGQSGNAGGDVSGDGSVTTREEDGSANANIKNSNLTSTNKNASVLENGEVKSGPPPLAPIPSGHPFSPNIPPNFPPTVASNVVPSIPSPAHVPSLLSLIPLHILPSTPTSHTRSPSTRSPSTRPSSTRSSSPHSPSPRSSRTSMYSMHTLGAYDDAFEAWARRQSGVESHDNVDHDSVDRHHVDRIHDDDDHEDHHVDIPTFTDHPDTDPIVMTRGSPSRLSFETGGTGGTLGAYDDAFEAWAFGD
ncbi:uncharacterized protein SPPG_04850 [Spizellomyces punctatus DAOM BR117]|uniref:Attractin/MKLN-like beta-propeller domain-containing protein n=1 Tax=Spizellomyces punctatus (strain DAOM BR117) TaxID=645134 RepID=A0A0L0HHI0_SPIPD|nr:uncharacterized protein SPPG_04850 [Spizellomyces punctatus DAOM BR117]KND00542.1 hypothetical protein SPPG_04850 [Spizellomyces punctatus DAOM BR117]|eukprot:XP_016608581.1 hypothetical protein SPPG_04850 [Spizellomyces punctatus DAOM BR117]